MQAGDWPDPCYLRGKPRDVSDSYTPISIKYAILVKHDAWSMIHDPCFMTCGALCEQAQFVICPRRTRKTSVRVRFGFHIFVGKQKKPVFILEYPNGLKGTTCLVKIVSGDVDAKKMGWPSWSVPWNPTTARQQERHKNYRFNKAKQPFFTCSSLFFVHFITITARLRGENA